MASHPVYFSVLRSKSWERTGVIPFQQAILDVGESLNITSGYFTAPRKGNYFFTFTASGYIPSSTSRINRIVVGLNLNNVTAAYSNAEGVSTVSQYEPLALQAALDLQAGDKVYLQITSLSSGARLDGPTFRYAQFSGWLLQEDLSSILSDL